GEGGAGVETAEEGKEIIFINRIDKVVRLGEIRTRLFFLSRLFCGNKVSHGLFSNFSGIRFR
ncbi:MAG TPA: hypothetical protein PKJ24_06210, partial [Prolixibacteraceae bacterium]|nr:hypothetical protein [Prolixibacteraceae bacterium]